MSAFTRMMEDYDYHKHTGELPEYFGGGNENNRGCGFGIFVAIVLFSAFLYATCGSDKKDNPKQQKTELVNQPVQVPLIPSDPSTVPQPPVVSDDGWLILIAT